MDTQDTFAETVLIDRRQHCTFKLNAENTVWQAVFFFTWKRGRATAYVYRTSISVLSDALWPEFQILSKIYEVVFKKIMQELSFTTYQQNFIKKTDWSYETVTKTTLIFLKFLFSKKATKIDKIFTVNMTWTTQHQINRELSKQANKI